MRFRTREKCWINVLCPQLHPPAAPPDKRAVSPAAPTSGRIFLIALSSLRWVLSESIVVLPQGLGTQHLGQPSILGSPRTQYFKFPCFCARPGLLLSGRSRGQPVEATTSCHHPVSKKRRQEKRHAQPEAARYLDVSRRQRCWSQPSQAVARSSRASCRRWNRRCMTRLRRSSIVCGLPATW